MATLIFKGEWVSTTSYKTGDIVWLDVSGTDKSYKALRDNDNKAPNTETDDWEYLYDGEHKFVVPSGFGITEIDVECWGAGGSGAGASAGGAYPGGGGGGAGAYSKKEITVIPETDIALSVAPLSAGGANATNGNDGASSWVKENGANGCVAVGGKKGLVTGTAGAGGLNTDCYGDTKYSGGNGANNTSYNGGGGGGGAGSTGAGGNASGTTKGTGTSVNGGDGGNGSTGNDGFPGSVYGGGGGGGNFFNSGAITYKGGSGAGGVVMISYETEFASTFTTPLTSLTIPAMTAIGVSEWTIPLTPLILKLTLPSFIAKWSRLKKISKNTATLKNINKN